MVRKSPRLKHMSISLSPQSKSPMKVRSRRKPVQTSEVTESEALVNIRTMLSRNATLDDAAKVKNNLRIFNLAYLQSVKEKASQPGLKAIAKMRKMNAILFGERRIGDLPGVHVGDHFFSRAELAGVGIHKHWLNGIDYMNKAVNGTEDLKFPLAVSIVISGCYEDDVDNAEEVVYTGSGGNNLHGDRRQVKDQKLVKGNLALKNCVDTGTPVRVIRGHDSKHSYTKRVFTYDGLYKVVEYWAEKGISGFVVYKYRLKRCDGQPVLTTDQVHFCKGKVPESTSQIKGLVCRDISNGLEPVPVPATNLVDASLPDDFRYTNKVEVSKEITIPDPPAGCSCKGLCTDPRTCSCAKRNGHTFPYVDSQGGRLAVPLDVVYECGPNCGCGPDCLNRVTQRGLQYRLEVYKTAHKGWAVRSWDPIPAGAPVCEYYGKLVKAEGLEVKNDVYIFDLDCIQTMKGVDGRQRRSGAITKVEDGAAYAVSEAEAGHAEFCLDGHECGGVARFINHSCDPNLFIQCVLSSHNDMRMPRIVLFAADNISPLQVRCDEFCSVAHGDVLQELSYDYGYQLNSVVEGDGHIKQLPCYCGAINCRKRLY